MTYKIMIKQHNVTGLKYLCITKKDDYAKYHGSGSYWTKHIKKHGFDVTTTVLDETDDLNELQRLGEYYSKKYNVVENPEFANLIPERGYAYPNDDPFYKYNKKDKAELYKQIAETNRKLWSDKSSEEIEEHSLKMKKVWSDMSDEDYDLVCSKLKSLWDNENNDPIGMDHVGIGYGEKRRKNYSIKMKDVRKNKSDSELKEWNSNIAKGRLAMSVEAKERRKEKILDFWDANEELKQFNNKKMSEERQGIDNPYAKVVEYKGIKYTKMKFEKEFGKVDKFANDPYFKKLYSDEIKEYPILTCPYCGKQSDPHKSQSAFKRWHFEHCKFKK